MKTISKDDSLKVYGLFRLAADHYAKAREFEFAMRRALGKDPNDQDELSDAIYRRDEGSLTTRDVTLALLAERGMDAGDVNLFRLMRQRVACALRGQRDKGVIRSVEGPGQYMNWELAA